MAKKLDPIHRGEILLLEYLEPLEHVAVPPGQGHQCPPAPD